MLDQQIRYFWATEHKWAKAYLFNYLKQEREKNSMIEYKIKSENQEWAKLPVDLDSAVVALKEVMPIDIDTKNIRVEQLRQNTIAFFGRSMRNTWKLWTHSTPLSKWFHNVGIYHPDDITGIIVERYVCDVYSLPFDLKKEVEKYRAYWKNLGRDPDFITK